MGQTVSIILRAEDRVRLAAVVADRNRPQKHVFRARIILLSAERLLSAKHGVHQTMINAWKKQAIEGLSGTFSGKAEAAEESRQGEIDTLHTMIGQLVVERDFLKRASGR